MNNGKICVAVCAATAEELVNNVRHAAEFADIVELRFDYLRSGEIDKTFQKLLVADLKIPMIATFRPVEQGGKRTLTDRERSAFWSRYPQLFWGGDFEVDASKYSDTWKNTIISHHDFSGVPGDIASVYTQLSSYDADVVKIAVNANDIIDTIPIWKLLNTAKAGNQEMIPIAMGEVGKWTRILGLAHGAFLTYAALETGNETAPGQISAKDMAGLYRVKELDEKTSVYGLLAGNTSYSLSPVIQNSAFKAAGINSVFVPLQVANLDEFMRRMAKPETREIEINLRGFAVTNPYKKSVVKHLDSKDETALKIGAVNTIKIENGKFHGYNTDAAGFIEPLIIRLGELKNARVAVAGAGGAARACIYALQKEGADVELFVRNLLATRDLANEFEITSSLLAKGNGQLTTDYRAFDIIVNTTPLGTSGVFEAMTIAEAEQLGGVKLVYDLVYNPSETRLIREAKKAGVQVIGGIEMLIAQGAKQFELWTGFKAPVNVMKESVMNRMRG